MDELDQSLALRPYYYLTAPSLSKNPTLYNFNQPFSTSAEFSTKTRMQFPVKLNATLHQAHFSCETDAHSDLRICQMPDG
jgi:hypothetical protein